MEVVELLSEIYVLNARLNRFLGRVITDMDLSVPQAKIVFLLACTNRETVCQKDIDSCFSMTHSSTSGILARMQAKGLIDYYVDPDDRRKKVLVLTREGKECYQTLQERFHGKEAAFVKNVSKEDVAQFDRTLMAMIHNLKE